MPKLKLLADIYDQPQKDDDPRGLRSTKRITKGELFEATEAEAARLKEIGAALDPKEAAEQKRSEAEQKAKALREEADRLEAEAKGAEAADAADDSSVEGLTGPEINKRLKALDLPVSGKVEDRRARLAEALAAEPQE